MRTTVYTFPCGGDRALAPQMATFLSLLPGGHMITATVQSPPGNSSNRRLFPTSNFGDHT